MHVNVKEEEWGVIYRFVLDGKEHNVLAISLHGYFLEIEVCKRNPRSGSRLHSCIFRSEASFLLSFITSARKLVVEPPMMVDLSLIVAAVTDADTCLRCGLTTSLLTVTT